MRALTCRLWVRLCADEGSATIEYALVALAAAVFAAVLFTVVSGQSVTTAVTDLIHRALSIRL